MSRPELTAHQRSLLTAIYTEIQKRHIPVAQNQKSGLEGQRTAMFGFRRRFNMSFGPSVWCTRRAHLWNLLKHYGATLSIPWDCVAVNENATCGRHRDKNNVDMSYIVSFGNYEGGELHVEDTHPLAPPTVYNCNLQPLIFDGANVHWNASHTGIKYSLVFFQTSMPVWWRARRVPVYPDNWREDAEYIQIMTPTPLQDGVIKSDEPDICDTVIQPGQYTTDEDTEDAGILQSTHG